MFRVKGVPPLILFIYDIWFLVCFGERCKALIKWSSFMNTAFDESIGTALITFYSINEELYQLATLI